MKKGFTLIELLVVVLIIGILAAIALPQYQVSVAKARASEMFINVKALRTASDAYELATGQRPISFDQIDIEIPYVSTCDDGGANYHVGGCIRTAKDIVYGFDVDGYIHSAYKGIAISSWYKNTGLWKGTYTCRASVNNKADNQACKSLGGVFNGVQTNTNRNVYAIN